MRDLDLLARDAYEAFLAKATPLCPELAAMQPPWEQVPEVIREGWRAAAQAVLLRAGVENEGSRA